MAESWQERLKTVGSNLLYLEVNTAVKSGMVVQKIPELPIGLHVIAELYSDHLQEIEYPVTDYLIRAGASRVIDLDRQGNKFRKLMEAWPFHDGQTADWEPPGWSPDWKPQRQPAAALTNGVEAFEALQWAAYAAERDGDFDHRERALLARIRSNSRQLKEVATVLERQFSSGQRPGLQASEQTFDERLEMVARGTLDSNVQRSSRLFGGTLEQTARALFQHPRPILSIDPDLTVLVRKVWDLGLEEVLYQTVIQLDGDVLVRVSEIKNDVQRAFLSELHRQAVDDGQRQWGVLFQIIGLLIRDLGQVIFGARTG